MRSLDEIIVDNERAVAVFKKAGIKPMACTCSACLFKSPSARLRNLPGYPVLCDNCASMQKRVWTPAN